MYLQRKCWQIDEDVYTHVVFTFSCNNKQFLKWLNNIYNSTPNNNFFHIFCSVTNVSIFFLDGHAKSLTSHVSVITKNWVILQKQWPNGLHEGSSDGVKLPSLNYCLPCDDMTE